MLFAMTRLPALIFVTLMGLWTPWVAWAQTVRCDEVFPSQQALRLAPLRVNDGPVIQGILTIPQGRKLYFEGFVPRENRDPVLVFLPGIFRGLRRSSDLFLKQLEEQGIAYVAMHFSTHPDSVARLNAKDRPDFEGVSSKDLAGEVVQLVETLGIENPLPVSLSYSGTVTSHLPKTIFPVVIETAPLGRFDESNPEIAAATRIWSDWLSMWPGGAWIAKIQRDIAFNTYWSRVVDGLAEALPELKEGSRSQWATEGFVAMAKAVEDYDIRKQDFLDSPQRIFILGEKEEGRRLKLQSEAIIEAGRQTGKAIEVYKIEGAGHIIPADQPEKYLQLLKDISSQVDSF